MKRTLLAISIILCNAIPVLTPEAQAKPPADILEAIEICDELDIRPIEGLWSYPEDDVMVMILRDEAMEGEYAVYVVESADCSLKAGQRLGSLKESPDAAKYGLSLFTTVKKGVLRTPCNATATLSASGDAIRVTKPSLKFSLRMYRLLPSFWRTVGVSVKDANSVPKGMIKVYPSYDGNNSSRRVCRYL